MTRPFLALAGVALTLGLFGCSGGDKADETVKISAPINNSAPEAKNAPAAGVDPSIQYPGMKKKAGAGGP